MPGDQKTQTKEFLRSVDIRTMRKDIKRLREADSLKERAKISNIKMVAPAQKEVARQITVSQKENLATTVLPPKPVIAAPIPAAMQSTNPGPLQPKEPLKASPATQANPAIEKIIQHEADQEKLGMENLRKYASEEEKQQIFLLESQKKDLEKQIGADTQNSEPTLLLEKNDILIQQNNLQKKLRPLATQSEQDEAEQKMLENRLQEANVPEEKQRLQKELWAKQQKQQETEKQRWAIESQLSKLDNRMKELESNYQKSGAQENSLRQDMAKIDATLKTIYSQIATRQKAKQEELLRPAPKNITPEINEIKRQQNIQSEQGKEKEYFNKIPQAAKEKLATATKTEVEQRKKFMEDVEKWASASEKENNNQNTNE